MDTGIKNTLNEDGNDAKVNTFIEDSKKISVPLSAAGDLRSVHTLPLASAEGRVPSGAGGANPLQHSGGPDQPGFGLPARGSRKVARQLPRPRLVAWLLQQFGMWLPVPSVWWRVVSRVLLKGHVDPHPLVPL